MPKQRDARSLGYTVSHEVDGQIYAYSYTRPDGGADSEGFDTAAEAWEAAEGDARLWVADHGDGLDALDALDAFKGACAKIEVCISWAAQHGYTGAAGAAEQLGALTGREMFEDQPYYSAHDWRAKSEG